MFSTLMSYMMSVSPKSQQPMYLHHISRSTSRASARSESFDDASEAVDIIASLDNLAFRYDERKFVHDDVVSWFKARLTVGGFSADKFTDDHVAVLSDFVHNANTTKIVFYVDKHIGLCAQTLTVPNLEKTRSIQFFVKTTAVDELTIDNLDDTVQFGVVTGHAMDSLLKAMQSVYMPTFLSNTTWPESVHKEFSVQLHKFMASLTETSNQVKGHTVLYIPLVNLDNVDECVKDKDLVQLLESTLIHWTRQIKEVVSNQETSHHIDTYSGPLEEIQFWESRTLDLSGIRGQLDKPGVRKIVEMLSKAKSSYLPSFLVPANKIQEGSREAQNNLKFLRTLQRPCERLANAAPLRVPSLLPEIVNLIRMIWTLSPYYGSSERITGLLRKISNQIIIQCTKKIDLNEIWDGDVESSMQQLVECIQCGDAWKSIYHKVCTRINNNAASAAGGGGSSDDRRWDFDASAIFAQLDAFMQRCRDLLEVCEGELQFARRSSNVLRGAKGPLPTFGGSRGLEVEKSFYEIEETFAKHIDRLRHLEYDILDVKATRWHDDYNTFKNAMRDLEMMMNNVISSAWQGISTVKSGCELLRTLYGLAKRSAMVKSVKKKTSQIYQMFTEELRQVRQDFEHHRKAPPLPGGHPHYAGAAIWAKGLMDRIDTSMRVLNEADFLPNTPESREAINNYTQFRGVLTAYIHQLHLQWSESMSQEDKSSLTAKLEKPLMVRVSANDNGVTDATTLQPINRNISGRLSCNFDKDLLRMFNEVRYWEKMGSDFTIPYTALEISGREEELRVVRESVMLVVRAYNSIISTLNLEERRLFSQHLRMIDRRLLPGLNRLTWNTPHIKNYFVAKCLDECKKVQEIVTKFKENYERVIENCTNISSMLWVDIEKNKIYEDRYFQQLQALHLDRVKKTISECHRDIVSTLNACHLFFADHPHQIQKEWVKYVRKIDRKVEDACHSAAKKSLQELSKAINGEAKGGNTYGALFKVSMMLEEGKGVIQFRPSMAELDQTIKQVSAQAIKCLRVLPRLPETLMSVRSYRQDHNEQATEVKFSNGGGGGSTVDADTAETATKANRLQLGNARQLPSLYDSISNDDEILKVFVSISRGTQDLSLDLQKIISHYDRYNPIWSMDKIAFIRRYAGQARPLESFELDITRYRNHQQDIHSEDPSHTIRFIRVDCTKLKQALIGHCQLWQQKLTTLLHKIASSELNDLHEMFASNTKQLKCVPTSVDQLGEKMVLLRGVHEEMEDTAKRFEPLEAKFKCLDSFEVMVGDEEREKLDRLRGAWADFQTTIQEADVMLQSCKVNMKRDLEDRLAASNQHLVDLRSEFLENAPFSTNTNEAGEVDVEHAFAFINDFTRKLSDHEAKVVTMKPGLDIFELTHPDSKDFEDTQKELGYLQKLWSLMRDWLRLWREWKKSKFSTFDTDTLEREAQRFAKTLTKFPRQVKLWKTWSALTDMVKNVRQIVPLLNDLRNPAMRDRHWERLMEEIQRIFDCNSDEFTLESLFQLGIHMHADVIAAISAQANRELGVEEGIKEVKSTWDRLEFTMIRHKGKYWKVQSSDELNDNLENHQLTLATIKNSPYFVTFSRDINYWMRTLNEIAEVLEVLMQVQRQWMYLESIFMDSPDIRKQLPAENSIFQHVNDSWREIAERFQRKRSVLLCILEPGLLHQFTRMNEKLDKIQHQLDQYLEKKRQQFPRFYFLSNDDLLEILGQTKDASLVQKHVHKCFMGINELIIDGVDGHEGSYQITGMKSADGEEVQLLYPVGVNGAVEGWLSEVEVAMRETLKKLLQLGIQSVAKSSKKNLQWIKSTVGQLVLTADQVGWTAECTKALQELSKNKRSMKHLRSKWNTYLHNLTQYVRQKLDPIDRLKLISLITVEVHARDVIEKLKNHAKQGVSSFEWVSQLRFYWDRDEGEYGQCTVKQTNTMFDYGYEYQGNNGRLVITPLTDRCYMTLTTALNLCRGGSPQGPAGTGKTETVKDLGKSLGRFVVVFNCTNKMGVDSVAHNFAGLAQTGAWGCFDEFNRINLDVLSVVALQISSILSAVQERATHFNFEGSDISLNTNVGIFVTMNPGYAGRTELPDNLKSLFRPVAMMVPDSQLIAEVILHAQGFKEAHMLSKKVVSINRLMVEKLSKQHHYDYGLRAIKGILTRAGLLNLAIDTAAAAAASVAAAASGDGVAMNVNGTSTVGAVVGANAPATGASSGGGGAGANGLSMDEEALLLRAILDTTYPKLLAEDVALFHGLLKDLFPTLDVPAPDTGVLVTEVRRQLRGQGLQETDCLVEKIMQLHKSMCTRHGNMIVGQTCGGKSTAWRTLQRAFNALAATNNQQYGSTVEVSILNPKCVDTNELYGNYDSNREWCDGILSTMLRKACDNDDKRMQKWIVLDGPVDTLWIESMNTALDDSKVLTLVNGDRIALKSNVHLLFEVDNLDHASPATVSRCGMVYFDANDLGWRPYMDSWLERRRNGTTEASAANATNDNSSATDVPNAATNNTTNNGGGGGGNGGNGNAGVNSSNGTNTNNNGRANSPSKAAAEEVEILKRLLDKYLRPLLEFKRTQCYEPVPITDFNAVQSFCRLYDSVATWEGGVDLRGDEMNATTTRMIELWFLFCVIWSCGAAVDRPSRQKIDHFIRDIEAQFPPLKTVYEYCVDVQKKDWVLWEERENKAWRPPKNVPFHTIMVPTVDTTRHTFLLNILQRERWPVLLVGATGTGKTSVVSHLLKTLDHSKDITLTVNFSAATNARMTQEAIESRLEKRQRSNYGPLNARQRLVLFIDDLNMPEKDEYGTQAPIQLLRQWMDYGFLYDRQKLFTKNIGAMQMMAAMGPPGGARSVLSSRFQSRFNLVHVLFPESDQVLRIFNSLTSEHLHAFDEEIKPLGELMSQATLELYTEVCEKFLPTPPKSHYLFNMRDMSRVFQGILQSDPKYYDTRESMIRLWVHESLRVFNDRLVDAIDQRRFQKVLNDKLQSIFEVSWKRLFDDADYTYSPLFSAFLNSENSVDDKDERIPYVEITDTTELHEFMMDKLASYNMDPEYTPMKLVLFRTAVQHITRIYRIITSPRGSAMLIGVGGTGRRSLTKLAAYIANQKCFQVVTTKSYCRADFREDLKQLYRLTGVEGSAVTFLFADSQLVNESFLEDINSILTCGEVPKLFSEEELSGIFDEIRDMCPEMSTESSRDVLYQYFIQRAYDNLHIVLCMSPVGNGLRNRVRKYPGLVNNTAIDHFSHWPKEALLEVAQKLLSDSAYILPKYRESVAEIFTEIHTSTVSMSSTMQTELRRHNYVTPTSYLDFANGYQHVLATKSQHFQVLATNLENGVEKLDQSRESVTQLTRELETKRKHVAQKKIDCEKLLVEIAQKRRLADEQKKQVQQDAIRTEEDTKECTRIREEAQFELGKVMPALERAEEALSNLSKSAVTEVQSYRKPPPLVEKVMAAVMTVLKKEPTWAQAKKELSDPGFIKRLKNFKKDRITNPQLKLINRYTKQKDFDPQQISKVSSAAGALADWVIAMELYAIAFRAVEPRRLALNIAEEKLKKKQEVLMAAREQLEEVAMKLNKLQERYDANEHEKLQLGREADEVQLKLSRAAKIVDGLSGERTRWKQQSAEYRGGMHNLVGDCVLAAAFLAYAGPFPSHYRTMLVQEQWIPLLKQSELPYSQDFSFHSFFADAADVLEWNIQGLPTDAFSVENGILMLRGNRFPLAVDPQGQAAGWLKARHESNGDKLKVLDPSALNDDGVRTIESAIQLGVSVLLEGVADDIPPVIRSLLQNLTRFDDTSVERVVRFAGKELVVSPSFVLYICTRLANPHYPPEVTTTITLVNFAVKQQGLEEQLLGIVVAAEEPKLEDDKKRLVIAVSRGRRHLNELEDKVLSLLKGAGPDLLDDEVLINALQSSKSTAEDVKRQLRVTEETEVKIDAARDAYRPAAHRSALIFMVLCDMSHIDPMYQYSLDSYVELFQASIEKSREPKGRRRKDKTKNSRLAERVKVIASYHTAAVYKQTCRGLFERHKLLFAFQLCMKKLKSEGLINEEEGDFFLRGGTLLDRTIRPPNMCADWLPESYWDAVTLLEDIPAFKGITASFEQNSEEWRDWYSSTCPEKLKPIGQWSNKWSMFHRLIVIKSLRPDRLVFAVRDFIADPRHLGPEFVEPVTLNLADVYESSTASTPIIFILASGVDPLPLLVQLASERKQTVKQLALGQDQVPLAERMIDDARERGDWIFLANCHLSIGWMPQLEKIIEGFTADNVHRDFRIWLSSDPHPSFPVSLLQRATKLTTEQPRGLRANMLRLYDQITEEHFKQCGKPELYKKLLFSLVYCHAVLVERRKFMSLGWNVSYAFNDADFAVCENILSVYLDEYDEVPWDALRYLIGEASYGGRVTDTMDRRLLNVYMQQFFNEDILNIPNYGLIPGVPEFTIPAEGDSVQVYKKSVMNLPLEDPAHAFGQHTNAEMSAQTMQASALLLSMLSLQPRVVENGAMPPEKVVLSLIDRLLEQIPNEIELDKATALSADHSNKQISPLHTVLIQECSRYNELLSIIKQCLHELHDGLDGLVVITRDMELLFDALYAGTVPDVWQTVYPSCKPLGEWVQDLGQRLQQMRSWCAEGAPKVFWLPGFTFPTGFLTALMQQSSRHTGISIDNLMWEFTVVPNEEKIMVAPKEGAYIKGMILEGARWDYENGCLADALPMELACPMPIVHFKPVELRKKSSKSVYTCPLYLYPIRGGTLTRPSFMVNVDLKSGNYDPEFWIKRGTALLLSD